MANTNTDRPNGQVDHDYYHVDEQNNIINHEPATNTTTQPNSTNTTNANTGTPMPARISKTGPTFLVIGAGSRGHAYANAVTIATNGRVVAVCEPDEGKRRGFWERYIKPHRSNEVVEAAGSEVPAEGECWSGWEEWIASYSAIGSEQSSGKGDRKGDDERDYLTDHHGNIVAPTPSTRNTAYQGPSKTNRPHIDALFICTLDPTHIQIFRALHRASLLSHFHIFCEKPLALSLNDVLEIQSYLTPPLPPGEARTETSPAPAKKIFSIGHVLRYSPHNLLLYRLLKVDRAIGDVLSIEHTEPVGYWHFAHSYVRGSWRHEVGGVGTLLTKCGHDVDFLLWLLCSPTGRSSDSTAAGDDGKVDVNGRAQPHLPSSIFSTGARSHFTRANKPKEAVEAGATNCLACPLQDKGCIYSAKRIYRDRFLRQRRDRGWPLKIVVPEIEDLLKPQRDACGEQRRRVGKRDDGADDDNGNDNDNEEGWARVEARLLERLGEDYVEAERRSDKVRSRPWYGRCVYESDNDVCDEQTTVLTWKGEDASAGSRGSHKPSLSAPNSSSTSRVRGHNPKTAILHMPHATQSQCERRGRIYGSLGEITYDSQTISVITFADEKTTTHEVPRPRYEESHGGGDFGLVGNFVGAVEAVESGEMSVRDAQWRFVGCDVEEVVRSHAVVFAGEESRRVGQIVGFGDWWRGKQAMFHGRAQERLIDEGVAAKLELA